MARLIVLSGIPGTGKSTFAKKRLIQYSNYISRDEIRFNLLRAGEDYFAHERQVWAEYIAHIADLLNEGKDVIADSTNLSKKSRKKLFNDLDLFVNKDFTIEIYSFKVPIQIALARNAHRERRERVPDDVLRKMEKSFIFPSYEEDSRIQVIFEVNENEEVRLI